MEIILKHSDGYKWASNNGVYFKGYLVVRETGEVLKEEKAIGVLSKVCSQNDLQSLLLACEGVYAVVIENQGRVLFAVDRARSLPLFYDVKGSAISDSAEALREYLRIAPENVDSEFYKALYAKTYIYCHFTAYSQIRQLDLGELAEIKGEDISIKRYFIHKADKIIDATESYYIEELDAVSRKAFKRIKDVIGNRPVVLSMSGGYDSRYVACMLKIMGVDDVSCYTYGKKDSFEVKQSKKNAEALGFRWICVEHSDEIVNKTFDDLGKKYIDSFDTHDYIAYLQNFPAVRELHERGWFKPGSVFITGLCGDMPTGYYIPDYDEGIEYNNQYAVEWLYKTIYERQTIVGDFKSKWIQYCLKELDELDICVCDYQSFVTAIDVIYTTTCHAHCYLHMNRAHEFFGYEWLIPYWDSELLSLWYAIPAVLRRKQHIYEEFLLNYLCKDYGIGQKKTVVGYSNNRFKKKFQYLVGGTLNWLLLHIGVPFKRKFDFNNWAPLELLLYKNLKTKKTVVYQHAGLISLLTQYTLQKRYGASNMIKAKKELE